MPDIIKSNLIIQTSLRKPTGSGLTNTLSQLRKIRDVMNTINRRKVKVKVALSGSERALSVLTSLDEIQKRLNLSNKNGPVAPGPGPGGTGTAERVVENRNSKGQKRTETRRDLNGGSLTQTDTTTNEKGELINEKITETNIDAKTETDERIAQRKKEIKESLRAAEQERQALERRSRISQRVTEVQNRLTAANYRVARSVERINTVTGETSVLQTWSRRLRDGSESMITLDSATGKVRRSLNTNTEAYRNHTKALQLEHNAMQGVLDEQDLLEQGYRRHRRTVRDVTVGNRNMQTSLTELRRVSGSPLAGTYAVDIAKVDTATGRLTRTTLRGADAVRAMGDSFQSAIRKVSLWFAATGTLFAIGGGIRFAAGQIKELEQNTIFLARVGNSLVASNKALGSSFEDRLQEAKLLTNQLVELSAELGNNAVEAQQAASIFLRAGQTRVQALESTRAALLAARIAELDTLESAKLLSSAQLQFNLSLARTLPTLDSLNTLSNNYRVTTDDLLQSISRAGSVYAGANGTLEQLAATTAIVSERTGRAGAEIGNALKLIQSRLTAPEVLSAILDKTGISMQDTADRTKNLNTILLQLRSATATLSAAERDRLLVIIGGARRINILRNAIDGVTDSVIAEAKALRNTGSATEEAIENARSLEAAMLRLRGEFVEVINDSSSGIGKLLTSLTNVLTLLLKLANFADGLGVKIAAVTLAFFTLNFIVHRAAVAIIAYNATLAAGTVASGAMTGATLGLSAAFTALQVALGPLGLLSLALTGAITALVYLFGNYSENAAVAAIKTRDLSKSQEQLAITTDRQAKAQRSLVAAIRERLNALQKLRDAQTKNGGRGYEADIAAAEDDIERLANSAGIKIDTSDIDKQDAELEKIDNAQKKRQEENATRRAKQIEREIKKQQELSKEAQKQALFQQRAAQNALERGSQRDAQARLKDVQDFVKKMQEAQNETERLRKLLADVDKDFGGTTAAERYSDETKKTVENLKRMQGEVERIQKLRRIEADFGEIVPVFQDGELDNQITELKDIISKGTAELDKFTAAEKGAKDQTEKWADSLVTANKILAELEKRQISESIKKYGDSIARNIKIESDFSRAVATTDAKLRLLRKNSPDQGILGSSIDDSRVELEVLQEEAKRLAEQLANVNTDAPLLEQQAFIDQTKNQLAKIQEEIIGEQANLLDQVHQKELDIVKAKQEANAETRKQLGLLSDEDKIRVLQQAKFFKDNPNARISAEQQFFSSADQNRLLQQNFAGRLDQADGSTPFDQFLLSGGVGNQALANANKQEEALREFYARYSGPGGDLDSVRSGLLFEQRTASNQIDRVAGGPQLATVQQNMPRDVVNTAQNFDVNVHAPQSLVDFNPLIDKFEDVVNVQLQEIRDYVVQRFEEINAATGKLINPEDPETG